MEDGTLPGNYRTFIINSLSPEDNQGNMKWGNQNWSERMKSQHKHSWCREKKFFGKYMSMNNRDAWNCFIWNHPTHPSIEKTSKLIWWWWWWNKNIRFDAKKRKNFPMIYWKRLFIIFLKMLNMLMNSLMPTQYLGIHSILENWTLGISIYNMHNDAVTELTWLWWWWVFNCFVSDYYLQKNSISIIEKPREYYEWKNKNWKCVIYSRDCMEKYWKEANVDIMMIYIFLFFWLRPSAVDLS